MTPRTAKIIEEPRDESYEGLCRYCFQKGFIPQVVVPVGPKLSINGRQVLEDLSKYLGATEVVTAWPGTELHYGHTAHRYVLECRFEVLEIILAVAKGLFDWQGPNLPDDLAFLRSDGSTFLTNVAHEEEALIEGSEIELQDVSRVVPGLRLQAEG